LDSLFLVFSSQTTSRMGDKDDATTQCDPSQHPPSSRSSSQSCRLVLGVETVLVHVPLVQEIAGLRPKKPSKPKPANRGRFSKFYQNQAEAAQR
jgi:hypothetical protein